MLVKGYLALNVTNIKSQERQSTLAVSTLRWGNYAVLKVLIEARNPD